MTVFLQVPDRRLECRSAEFRWAWGRRCTRTADGQEHIRFSYIVDFIKCGMLPTFQQKQSFLYPWTQ